MITKMETRYSFTPTSMDRAITDPSLQAEIGGVTRALLACGIASSLLYVAMNIVVPLFAQHYNPLSQTVSELSAIGADTRYLWLALAIPYGFLMIAFGFGVWLSAGNRSSLKVVGFLLIFNSVIGFFWPPMNLRGVAPTSTDTMHIAFTGVAVMAFVLEMILASMAFGELFRVYTIFSIVILLLFGVLTGLEAPKIMLDLPTPMIGIWERIGIGSYILWLAVFAFALLQRIEVRTAAVNGEKKSVKGVSHV